VDRVGACAVEARFDFLRCFLSGELLFLPASIAPTVPAPGPPNAAAENIHFISQLQDIFRADTDRYGASSAVEYEGPAKCDGSTRQIRRADFCRAIERATA
jgi:hypothetical protein